MNKPQTRKANRLKCYDYSQNGAYFITICTKARKELFTVGGDVHIAPKTAVDGNVHDNVGGDVHIAPIIFGNGNEHGEEF